MVLEQVSEATKFHVTEALLLERAKLHGLVDYFWKVLPNTRDEVYQMISASLSVPDIHISDMTTEQIREVAKTFQEKLYLFAPCANCKNSRFTDYGMYLCNKSEGAYWERSDNVHRKCDYYVPRDIPVEGSE